VTRDRFNRLYELIGDRVCKARGAAHLSQLKLAQAVGINRVSIVNIEKGRQRPPIDLLWKIAETLNVELVQLIPRKADFDSANDGVQLSAEDLRAIQLATQGNVSAARQITDFVRRAKTRAQETT